MPGERVPDESKAFLHWLSGHKQLLETNLFAHEMEEMDYENYLRATA